MQIVIDNKSPTNGDLIKTLFPNLRQSVLTDHKEVIVIDYRTVKDWWNAPYEGGNSDADSD